MNIFKKIINYDGSYNISVLANQQEFLALYIKEVFDYHKSVLVVTPTLYEANKLYNSLCFYDNPLLFQVDELTLDTAISSPELKTERLDTINELSVNDKHIVITDIKGYLSKLPNMNSYKNLIMNLSVGMEIDIKKLAKKLVDRGYERTDIVTNTGELAIRGFVLDIYPISFELPVRIEIDFDQVSHIKQFDPNTQKTIKDIDSISIFPNSFVNSDENFVNISNYMPSSIVVFKDYDQCCISYERLLEDLKLSGNVIKLFNIEDIKVNKNIYLLDFDSKVSLKNIKNIKYDLKSVPAFKEDIISINSFLNKYNNKKTIVLSITNISQFFLDEINCNYVLSDVSNIVENKVNIIKNSMGSGFEYCNYIFLTDYELFNRKKEIKRKIHFKFTTKIRDVSKLEIGDYVVHSSYGIGIYNGIKTISKNNILNDYIEVLYDKGDKLYIPASKIELISKYSGKDGYAPPINALNSTSWAKTKAKVKEKIKYEAARLLKVQAERELKKGFAFSKDTPMQIMFESNFNFDETIDQLKAVKQIKDDMESIHPMDRILCGDVGYGKTEVAFRAMFKAVIDSKQVLYLCPTTLLCKQQYDAAVIRFKNFPVNIAMFSRFTSGKESRDIVEGLKNGSIDICFGTHRILSDQIRPKNLGLLIVDEEQRFGVAHKEKIKEFKSDVDVLTLTATPIPRTLQLAMLGLRDLSLIETPPKNRHSIQTYVIPYDKKMIRDIVYKEMSRNGQVFILYNQVENIELRKSEFEKLMPDAKIIVAHGQMSKIELEDRMNDFIAGEADVLLCTTIIETGIDIPNANSLIIIDADRFGLSQLYQIRGRVGRSDRVAYTYLMYNKNKVLNETAIKRLKVIKEFTSLGSGFAIATRDLSIRGAGDILGAEQAGFIDSVGIDLYMQMLNEEVSKLKGIEVINESNDDSMPLISVQNHISDEYVCDEDVKIEIHKLINEIDSIEKLKDVKLELEDRFGKIDDNMFIYMNEQLFESLIKKKEIEKVFTSKTYIELIVSEKKSSQINYEKLFIDSLSISNKFSFIYKDNKFYIRLITNNLDIHPVLLLNKLLYKM